MSYSNDSAQTEGEHAAEGEAIGRLRDLADEYCGTEVGVLYQRQWEDAVAGGMLTTAQAADRLGVRPRTVVQYIKRGLIAAAKHGRDYSISAPELARYLAERRKPGHPRKEG